MKPRITELQEFIATILAEEEKAYDLVGVCKFFGLDAKEGDHASASKRIMSVPYSRLNKKPF